MSEAHFETGESLVETPTRIFVLNTGGTIGMQPSPDGRGHIPAKTGEELVEGLNLPDGVEVSFAEMPELLDSTNVRYEDRIAMARVVAENYDDFDAVIVAHGTDSLAQTAGAFELIFGDDFQKPMIVLGSQNTKDESGGDMRNQTENAFRIAKHFASVDDPSRRYVGVYALANGHVFSGNRLRKRNESDFDFLDTPGKAPVADVRPQILVRDELANAFNKKKYFDGIKHGGIKPNEHYETDVLKLQITADTPPAAIRALVESGAIKGLIIEALGSGNVPDRQVESNYFDEVITSSIVDEIGNATRKGVMVGIISSFDDGRVDLSRYQLGVKAQEAGAIGMASLTSAFGEMKMRQAMGMFTLPKNFDQLDEADKQAALEKRKDIVGDYLQSDMFGEMLRGLAR